jgi:hypothetical protein
MRRDKTTSLCTGIIVAVLLGGPMTAFAQAGAALQNPPVADQNGAASPKQQSDEGLSGSSSGSLSHELSRSGGVIHPPANPDPGLTKPAPDLGPHSMPVIPPPGTPGGNPDIKPK